MIYLNDKKIAVIGIDHGYGNIKTANTITPTAVTEYDTEPVFSGNILEYVGKYYRIGEGHKEFIVNKAMDEDFYLLTLMGVACELNRAGMREANVHLAAGLPLTWVRKQRESFREYLLRNEKVEYRYNGKDYRVRFVGCSVYPQGYAAVVNTFGSLKGTNLLADIGNGTMNVLYIVERKLHDSGQERRHGQLRSEDRRFHRGTGAAHWHRRHRRQVPRLHHCRGEKVHRRHLRRPAQV